MKRYAVGQVLYVASSTSINVIPVQIVEELTKRTLAGEETTYVIRLGQDDKKMQLSEVEGDIYESCDQMKLALINRITSSISKLIVVAEQKAVKWYGVGSVESIPESIHENHDESDDVQVVLPDGTRARLVNRDIMG